MISHSPHQILKQYWNFDSFRFDQEKIIDSVLNGNDTLAIMPTGAGKSLCYQIPALCQAGICIVVSPLIALIKDQASNLRKLGIGALTIHSGMHYKEIDQAFDNAVHGSYKFLFLSPERLSSDIAKARIPKMNVNLLVVDEAHCVSEWGHDFRPSYHEIAQIREWVKDVPMIALTATATEAVRENIVEKLEMKKAQVFLSSLYRDNLAYWVEHSESKINRLFDIIRKNRGTGIVYAGTRRRTETIASQLKKQGVDAQAYHAGLASSVRSTIQEGWLNGKPKVIVSTNAFGMGIDKSNVRFVVHVDLPLSVHAYFQEAGRAGRDGQKAFCVLLYNDRSLQDLDFKSEHSYSTLEQLKQVYRSLTSYLELAVGGGKDDTFEFDIDEFCARFQLKSYDVYQAIKYFERAGKLMMNDSFRNPSSLKVIADKATLYKFSIDAPAYEELIKSLLRRHEGLFEQYVSINEETLASNCGCSTQKVRDMLNHLTSVGLVDYLKKPASASITFLQAREQVENLDIDHQLLNRLIEQKNRQVKQIKNYVTDHDHCRQQLLLQLFDERLEQVCGICDWCVKQKHQHVSNEKWNDLVEQAREILNTSSEVSVIELTKRMQADNDSQVKEVIRWMIDQGELVLSNNQIIQLNE